MQTLSYSNDASIDAKGRKVPLSEHYWRQDFDARLTGNANCEALLEAIQRLQDKAARHGISHPFDGHVIFENRFSFAFVIRPEQKGFSRFLSIDLEALSAQSPAYTTDELETFLWHEFGHFMQPPEMIARKDVLRALASAGLHILTSYCDKLGKQDPALQASLNVLQEQDFIEEIGLGRRQRLDDLLSSLPISVDEAGAISRKVTTLAEQYAAYQLLEGFLEAEADSWVGAMADNPAAFATGLAKMRGENLPAKASFWTSHEVLPAGRYYGHEDSLRLRTALVQTMTSEDKAAVLQRYLQPSRI